MSTVAHDAAASHARDGKRLGHTAAHALMHLTVLVWGFTAILGKLIQLPALPLVWYRLWIVVGVMAVVIAWRRLSFRISRTHVVSFAIVGTLVALHWLLFYGCIKYASVAVSVLCLSTNTFFTACLEPFVFKRRPDVRELVIGFGVMCGVSLLVRVETHTDMLGLGMGLASALFSASFGTLNGKLARESRPEIMTFYELLVALLVTTLFFAIRPAELVAPWSRSPIDVPLVVTLAVVCTVLPWLWSLRVLETLRPYALALAVSLEPVYAMLFAYLLLPAGEQLGWRFYAGASVLVGLVLLSTWRRKGAA